MPGRRSLAQHGMDLQFHSMRRFLPVILVLALGVLPSRGGAETAVHYLAPAGLPATRFPSPVRPVAPVVSDRWRDEDSRERVGEAARVTGWLGIHSGMTVADIGAGSGYYTMRIAGLVGPHGHVLAQDVTPDYVAQLSDRITQAGLTNVSVGLGDPGDPRLPRRSTDIAVMVHMYHEIRQPFALLGNLVPALRPGARVGIVDVDDVTERHGTPRALLMCELAASGYRPVAFHWLLIQPPRSEYLAVFEAPVTPPRPGSIRPCQS